MQHASASITERMMRAAKLETGVYEEIEADASATQQALWVVIIAAVLDGLGLALGAILFEGRAEGFLGGLLIGVASAIIGWVVWAWLTYFIGTQLFNGSATPGEMLRTIGFAQAPRVLNVFSFIPVLGGLLRFVVAIWLLIAGIVAIRQALDVTTGKAIATAIIGWLAMLVVFVIIGIIVAALGLGAGMPR
jgi:hypothetical protein